MRTLISISSTASFKMHFIRDDEDYIKRKCRERLAMAGTYLMLIGKDTRYKYKYVRREAEVAVEKKCRLIGVNLDRWYKMNPDTCRAFCAANTPNRPKRPVSPQCAILE